MFSGCVGKKHVARDWGAGWHCYADNGSYEVVVAKDAYIAARCFAANSGGGSNLSIVGIFRDGDETDGINYAIDGNGNLIEL